MPCSFRSALLGGDYSDRLFATVQTNTALAFCLLYLRCAPKVTEPVAVSLRGIHHKSGLVLGLGRKRDGLTGKVLTENVFHEGAVVKRMQPQTRTPNTAEETPPLIF